MNQPVEALRHPWMPVFRPVEGYRGERCQGDPAEGLYLGSITYSDCGVWDVELRYYMSTAGKGPCTYHLFEISDYGSGLKHLGYMEGDAPDHITAGLALWEAMLTGRDPRFLDPKAIVPGPSFSSEQAKEMLERVETSHMRALHPEAFPDLREQMLSSAQNLLVRAETLVMDLLPAGDASEGEPQGLKTVGLLWEENLLKVRYLARMEPKRLVLVQDRSRMEHFTGNLPLFRPISHEVRDVAACPLDPDMSAMALAVLMLLKFRPDHRLQYLDGIDGLTERGVRLLLAAPGLLLESWN